MRPEHLARARMRSQHLRRPLPAPPEDVLRCFGAMQGQEFEHALWSVGQRTAGATESDMRAAFDTGRVLRTHVVRPTWHLVAPEDLRWVIAATAHRVHQLNGPYYRSFGVAELTVDTTALLADAVSGGPRTRDELADVLRAHGVEASGPRLAYIVMRAELDRAVVSGGLRGRRHTYAAFDERVPPGPEPDRAEAQARLARVFFTSRGPATVKDFARWSSLTIREGRAALDAAVAAEPGALQQVEADGRRYWFAAGDPDPDPDAPSEPVTDLVQGYDEAVMSYSESRDVLVGDTPVADEDLPFLHAVLVDGRLAGHWTTGRRSSAGVTVDVQAYRPIDAAGRISLERAVARLGAFLETPAELGSIDVLTPGRPIRRSRRAAREDA
jgi:hypothetical protein